MHTGAHLLDQVQSTTPLHLTSHTSRCLGVYSEDKCMPCIECSKDADEFCNVCWTDALRASPVIKLGCNHRKSPLPASPTRRQTNTHTICLSFLSLSLSISLSLYSWISHNLPPSPSVSHPLACSPSHSHPLTCMNHLKTTQRILLLNWTWFFACVPVSIYVYVCNRACLRSFPQSFTSSASKSGSTSAGRPQKSISTLQSALSAACGWITHRLQAT